MTPFNKFLFIYVAVIIVAEVLIVLVYWPQKRVRTAPTPRGPRPATPQPNYICENCGMLIKSTHRHTREECEEYENDPTKPDKRLVKTIKENIRVGRNDPKIKLPYYSQSLQGSAKE